MSRSLAREAKPDSGPLPEPAAVRVCGRCREGMSLRRMATQVLVWVPILACLAASMGVGRTSGDAKGGHPKAEPAPDGESVTAVMRSAPSASETEGGMPGDLLRLVDEPVLAREQTERVALLYSRWALRNPLGAGQSALANARLFDSAEPLRAVLEVWLAEEPEAAMEWVAAGKSIPGKAERLDQAFGAAMETMPVSTRALWAARAPEDGGLVAEVAAEWARTEPAAAVEWLAGLKPGAHKDEGLRALVAAWMEADPARAGAFVATMEQGRLRDLALATVAGISPGGVALEADTTVAGTPGATLPEAEKEGDAEWLVRREGKGEAPRALKRLPEKSAER